MENEQIALKNEKTLIQSKEGLLIELNQLKNVAAAKSDNLNKEFAQEKEKLKIELYEFRKKENDEIQKMRINELEKLEKLRDQSFLDIQKNQKQFIKGLTLKIEAELVNKLKINFQEAPIKLMQEQLEELVLQSFHEQS